MRLTPMEHPAITERRFGPHGYAFRLPPDHHAPTALPEVVAANLATWVVHLLPNAQDRHPVYLLSLAHLRPVAGTAPPELSTPDASHEFMLLGLNPAYAPWDERWAYRVLCQGHRITWPRYQAYALHPPVVGLHLRQLSDASAADLVEPAVDALLYGRLPWFGDVR